MTPPDRVQDIRSYRLPAGFRGRTGPYVQLWWMVQATLFGLSPHFMFGWRRFLLRLFGCKVGKKVRTRPSTRIYFPWKVTLDDYCQIGDAAQLYSLDTIHVGHDVTISQGAYICTGTHDMARSSFDILVRPVVIEPEAWVCANAFVHLGVTIGRGAVIGACAVLTTDAAPYTVYAGNPARPIRARIPAAD